MLQANSTACGRNAGGRFIPPMQHADQREQAARSVEIEVHLARQPLHQEVGAFVVQGAAAHVERLDAVGRRGADRRVIAVAHRVIVLHHAPQRREREKMRHHRRAVGATDIESKARAGNAQVQRERSLLVVRGKGVVLEQIVDGDRTLVLDVGIGAADGRFVEGDRNEAVLLAMRRARRACHWGLKRIVTERACASSPSASPSAIAAGPSARN